MKIFGNINYMYYQKEPRNKSDIYITTARINIKKSPSNTEYVQIKTSFGDILVRRKKDGFLPVAVEFYKSGTPGETPVEAMKNVIKERYKLNINFCRGTSNIIRASSNRTITTFAGLFYIKHTIGLEHSLEMSWVDSEPILAFINSVESLHAVTWLMSHDIETSMLIGG